MSQNQITTLKKEGDIRNIFKPDIAIYASIAAYLENISAAKTLNGDDIHMNLPLIAIPQQAILAREQSMPEVLDQQRRNYTIMYRNRIIHHYSMFILSVTKKIGIREHVVNKSWCSSGLLERKYYEMSDIKITGSSEFLKTGLQLTLRKHCGLYKFFF